ncbi:DUF2254 domain-containing protein [Labedella phragmitis]|uniref:DUF2254 domain-containing protein n=1 Tax=Labedella phragmitis TaxID=2498849 RepID=A0A3S4AL83_9MICO|nr:DUF2254 domain-containing protein [Labedella phragmitis]RWZ51069.1 DUF2254 domain-containing protein [Labedella phragmitis]
MTLFRPSRGPAPSSSRVSRALEGVRASLWVLPAAAAFVTLVLALLLSIARPAGPSVWVELFWPGDASSAVGFLQTVATATMAAATLTFSLTVVALQLASQQFSPRLLREFARDRVTQSVLAVLVSSFVAALVGLREVNADDPLPVLLLVFVQVLALASTVALMLFLGHIVRVLRVDTMMLAVHAEAVATLGASYPRFEDRSRDVGPGVPGPAGGSIVGSLRSGFIRTVHWEALVDAARREDVLIRMGVRPGDHVTEGSPVLSAWPVGEATSVDLEALERAADAAMEFGFERTIEQDVALGFRQLTDIAVKAISPGINDPVTAAHAIGYCADLVRRLQGRRLGPRRYEDTEGTVRLVAPDRDVRYYLDLVCGPVRRFGRSEPIVLSALLRLLRDAAATARDETQREEIRRQSRLIVDGMSSDLLAADREAVLDLGRRVETALSGDVDAAYRDRAGETRSV